MLRFISPVTAEAVAFESEYVRAMTYDLAIVPGKGPKLTSVAGSPSGRLIAAGNVEVLIFSALLIFRIV